MKARHPPYWAHGNFNASLRLPVKYHGAGRSAQKDYRGLQGLIQIIIACRLWASKHGGVTFTVGVNALALSVIQKARKLDP